MNLLSICNEPGLMNVFRIVILLINIIKVVVPIVLIIFLMLKIMSAVSKQNQEEIAKTIKSSIPNIIAAALIFFVPMFVDMIAKLSFPSSDYSKCISGITKEKIAESYISKIEEMISHAEETEKYADYAAAVSYLSNIKDESKRDKYQERLYELKNKLDDKYKEEDKPKPNQNDYSKVDYSKFKWTRYQQKSGPAAEYYNDVTTYYVWGPEDVGALNGVSLPLIVWLHGIREVGTGGDITNTGLLKVIKEWDSYKLAPVPAIIVAPQTPEQTWRETRDLETIKALIKYAKNKYNINSTNITLMGHSMGGTGVVDVAPKMKDTFAALVVMSGVPNRRKVDDAEYFSKIKMIGYAEDETYGVFFSALNRKQDFILCKGVSHGNIPKAALTTDDNKDGISDLMYWLYAEKANINSTQSGSSGGSESGSSSSTSESSAPPPTPNPITKYVDVNTVNSTIASAVKSKGLYTRGAVVAAATTLINTLNASGYYVPYQLGGMYHRSGKWGINPEWGTVITHNNKQVLSGLDCRNFVNWSFKQAGLCLVRGFGVEGSTEKNRYTNKYSSLTEGRPGDVIDHLKHIMLIVSKTSDGYQVAESNGVGRVRLHNITIAEMKSFGYEVYNMDAIYDNTAYTCKEKSPYNVCDMSCHIDKSQFPKYYGF